MSILPAIQIASNSRSESSSEKGRDPVRAMILLESDVCCQCEV